MDFSISDGTTKTGWQLKTLTFALEQWPEDYEVVLSQCFNRAIDELTELYQQAGEEYFFNIELKIGEQPPLSEKTLWSLIFDSCGNDYQILTNYLTRWCEFAEASQWQVLPRPDEYHFVGEYALTLFFARYFDEDDSTTKAALPLYQCFTRFIKCCDLEHETYQDDLIHAVLQKLMCVDTDLFCELFCFRLMHGQLTYSEMGYRLLNKYLHPGLQRPGLLKPVLDFFIQNKNDAHFELSPHYGTLIRHLLGAVYGNNHEQIEDVVKYVEQGFGFEFLPVHPCLFYGVQRVMDECATHKKNHPDSNNKFYSGFHIYDGQTKQWLAIDK